jgi:hypothetical protein
MIFRFPKQEESILIHLKFKPSVFEKIKQIAEREECLRSDAIMVLLEAAIEEYEKQASGKAKEENTAYPLPPGPEHSPDEQRPKPTTLEEKIEQDRQYQQEYYQKNKKGLVAKKRGTAPLTGEIGGKA